MRGALLNYLSGMDNVVTSGSLPFHMDIGEMMFWMWRVQSIRISFVMSASLRAPDEDQGETEQDPIPSYSFEKTFYCPISTLDGTSSGPATEVHQAGLRRAYYSQPIPPFQFQSPILESQSSDDGSGDFRMRFGTHAAHNPFFDETQQWIIPLTLNASIANREGSSFSVRNSFSAGWEPTSFAVVILGTDLILNRTYSHTSVDPGATIPIYQFRTGLCSGGSGIVVIQPFEFYEWRDRNGVPLYNSNTGGYA